MTSTVYDQDDESALAELDNHTGPVVVDFDETLFLANSTTLFLASTRPALLAYLIVKVLDVIKPWRHTGGSPTRDAWRVKALLTLMPWTLRRWRRLAPELAASFVNEPLNDRLQNRGGQVIVSTLGFTPIVKPLLDAMSPGEYRLVSMEPSPAQRRAGKLDPTVEAVGADRMGKALFVTDSADDLNLLELVGKPLRVVWPDAQSVEPFPTIYYPTRYLHLVKRPGSNYRIKILKEDFALWILGSVWLADNFVTHSIGLGLLALSFWAVYEYGYIDNDRTGERFEKDPRLSEAYRQGLLDPSPLSAALWAIGAATVGIFILRYPEAPTPGDFVRWAVVLGLTVATFWIYNRIDKRTRVLVFPLLQLLRLAGFVMLVPTTAVASLVVALMVLMRAFNYYLYRTRKGEGWPDDDLSAVRFIVFIAATALFAGQDLLPTEESTASLRDPGPLTDLTLVMWQALLARRSLLAAARQAHRIDR